MNVAELRGQAGQRTACAPSWLVRSQRGASGNASPGSAPASRHRLRDAPGRKLRRAGRGSDPVVRQLRGRLRRVRRQALGGTRSNEPLDSPRRGCCSGTRPRSLRASHAGDSMDGGEDQIRHGDPLLFEWVERGSARDYVGQRVLVEHVDRGGTAAALKVLAPRWRGLPARLDQPRVRADCRAARDDRRCATRPQACAARDQSAGRPHRRTLQTAGHARRCTASSTTQGTGKPVMSRSRRTSSSSSR